MLLGIALLAYESFGLDEIAGQTNDGKLPVEVGMPSVDVAAAPKVLYQAFLVVYVL